MNTRTALTTLNGQTVLVTGATGNLGPYVTDRLVHTGAQPVGTYLVDASLQDIEDRAEEAESVSYYPADLTDQDEVETLVDEVEAAHGTVDHIVALAGGFSASPPPATDDEALRPALGRHVMTAYLTVWAFRKHLGAGSSVVLFRSSHSFPLTGGTSTHNVGKSDIRILTETLDAELEDVRVNALAPLVIDTPANRDAMPDADFSTWTAAASIADAVVHLLSSTGVSGEILQMPGEQPAL